MEKLSVYKSKRSNKFKLNSTNEGEKSCEKIYNHRLLNEIIKI